MATSEAAGFAGEAPDACWQLHAQGWTLREGLPCSCPRACCCTGGTGCAARMILHERRPDCGERCTGSGPWGTLAVSGLNVCASLEWSCGLRASRHQKSSVYNLLTQTAHGCYCLYALTHPDRPRSPRRRTLRCMSAVHMRWSTSIACIERPLMQYHSRCASSAASAAAGSRTAAWQTCWERPSRSVELPARFRSFSCEASRFRGRH